MLRKAQERDVIMHLRHRIDETDSLEEFKNLEASSPEQEKKRAYLGSAQKSFHCNSYAIHLRDTIKHTTFAESFQTFVQQKFHVKPISFGYWKVCSAISCKHSESNLRLFVKIIPHNSLRVTFVSQETGLKIQDIIHVSGNWRNNGPRYDTVIVQGLQSIFFAEIRAMFSTKINDSEVQVLVVHMFQTLGRNKSSQYIEVRKLDGFDFILADSVVRACHIIHPTVYNSVYTVQDLVDADMFLRLADIK